MIICREYNIWDFHRVTEVRLQKKCKRNLEILADTMKVLGVPGYPPKTPINGWDIPWYWALIGGLN